MNHPKPYSTAINCMDGKVQGAVRKDAKRRCHVDYVDMITQPGVVKILAENTNTARLNLIKEMIEISVIHHHSRHITIAAHHGCLGNPVTKKRQCKQLIIARETVKKMIKDLTLVDLDIKITLLWINENYLPDEVHLERGSSLFLQPLISVPDKKVIFA